MFTTQKWNLVCYSLIMVFALGCSCSRETDDGPTVSQRVKMYAPISMKSDISHLPQSEQKVVQLLIEASKLADSIFWQQSSADAITLREQLKKDQGSQENKDLLKYLYINKGPYDMIFEGKRFVGDGSPKLPAGANLYPTDLSKEEFEKYVADNPEQKGSLESQYTVVKRSGDKLTTIAYAKAYPEVNTIAQKLEEASNLTTDAGLKKYLKLRAQAILTDDYFESDMAWMDVVDGDIDIVIGPIENYIDKLFNYKTAYEGGIFIKDRAGTQTLQVYKSHIYNLEQNLPSDKKYIRKDIKAGKNVLKIVNAAYLGGDFQQGVKTIATSLPNDPRVHKAKGAKKIMFKNMIEAKFKRIVVPIGNKILHADLIKNIDPKSFMDFITLHEVSHTLGRGFVYQKPEMTVRKALKEKYSTIEEAKADTLSIYGHWYLKKVGIIDDKGLTNAMATYLAGLFRSIRFGVEEAHGKANLIQLNYLSKVGAIVEKDGKYAINQELFAKASKNLAKEILHIQAEGNYQAAVDFINKYGHLTEKTKQTITSLNDIPRDIDTTF